LPTSLGSRCVARSVGRADLAARRPGPSSFDGASLTKQLLTNIVNGLDTLLQGLLGPIITIPAGGLKI